MLQDSCGFFEKTVVKIDRFGSGLDCNIENLSF